MATKVEEINVFFSVLKEEKDFLYSYMDALT